GGRAELADPVHHLRVAACHGSEQAEDVVRGALQVRIEDHQVVAGSEARRGPHRCPLATVDRMTGNRDAPVVDAGQYPAGVVHAAVVDNDDLDVARIADVEDTL